MASLFSLVHFTLCLLLLSSPIFSNANTTQLDFTADLIHRDSPKSPFYNPAETPFQRLRNAINRSINHDLPSLNSAEASIIRDKGEYLMDVGIGSPPFSYKVFADTGSDLLSTQCKPCINCYPQDASIFNPKGSSTYKDLPCSSTRCAALLNRASCSIENTCSYVVTYGDQSYSSGSVAVETVSLDGSDIVDVKIRNFVFGCGHNNAGNFGRRAGIIGLGGGPASLIGQIRNAIQGKFSYCLTKTDTSSKINFGGTKADVSGPGTVSTPLVDRAPDTFYRVTLKSISVGDTQIKFPGSEFPSGKGNIIIDSGTTLTLLPPAFYSKIEDAVESYVIGVRTKDPGGHLSLCYSTDDLKIPYITMHFDGADVKPEPSSYFVQVSSDVVCLAFRGKMGQTVYGNMMQMDYLIGFDIFKRKVSFKPMDCTKMKM